VTEHDHPHGHDHPHSHEHDHGHQEAAWQPGVGPVLDIGGDVGALILYTDARFLDREIELSPVGDDSHRTHTAIHERRLGDQLLFAGVYPQLRAGTYRIWTDDPSLPDRVTIVGGEVAELDWRPFARP
jgi:hypothetical protein